MASSESSASAYVEGPRHAVITSDDVGPVITILTLLFMVIMILAVMLRLLVRFTASHVPGLDDAVVSIALLVAIGEVIAISVTVNHGLGTSASLLSEGQLSDVARGAYAANLLYLLTIALGKASTLLLLSRLTVLKRHKASVRGIAIFMIMWTVVALFGSAFQCRLPEPWLVGEGRCIDINSFWYAIGTFDILVDLVLVAMPAWIVWKLQMNWQRKVVVITGFAFRLLLCIAQAIRLAYLDSTLKRTIYSSLGYILATQFQTMFAVVVACIPAYKSFMDRAASGLIGVSFKERGGTYQLSSIGRSAEQRSKQSSRKRSVPVAGAEGDYHVQISGGSGSGQRSQRNQSSTSAGTEQRAQKTVEWEVRYSDEARLNAAENLPSLNVDDGPRASGSSTQVSPV